MDESPARFARFARNVWHVDEADDTAAALERLGIAPEARPETLTPEQFQQLAGIFGRSGC